MVPVGSPQCFPFRSDSVRPNAPLIGEYGLCNSHGTLITRPGLALMHLLWEQWGESMSVPVDGQRIHGHAARTHNFLPGLLLTLMILHLFSFKQTNTQIHALACSVICLCPPVRTEGRLALLKSLMARLWHPL